MQRRFVNAAVLIFLLLSSGATAKQRESLGTLKVQDITLRPTFEAREPSEVQFLIGESSIALAWSLDENLSALVRIGPETLINPMARFKNQTSEDLGLVEAYAQWSGVYGRLRAGLIPLEFGVEGEKTEANLRFPRSLLFANRALGLRDIGLSYRIEHNGFFTSVAVHNGEGDQSNLDGRVWTTAKWAWTDGRKFQGGFSAQTGTTKPASTSTSGDTLTAIDVNREAQWRLGGLFLDWEPSQWKLSFEAYLGESSQQKNLTKYSTGHFDVIYDFEPNFGMQLRFDMFDPNHKVDADVVKELSLGFRFSQKNQTSNIYLIGTKVFEEGRTQVNNDVARIIWSISP